jgi:uncharacterized protein (TIGR02217 family)
MSLIVLADVLLPNSVIAAGVRGKNRRQNSRAMNQGGFDTINVIWTRTLREFEVGIVPMLPAAWQALEGIFEVTEGGAFGFLMEDPKDTTVAAGTGVLQAFNAGALVGASGFGYGVPTARLIKRYTPAGTTRSKDRLITRPKAAPAVSRGSVGSLVQGAAPSNFSVDLATGIVTFVADASSAVSAVTVGATTQVTLAAALAGLAVADRLYLSGLTGADAALLNGLSHPITAIAGAVYTLGTNTAAKVITPAGSGAKYPQAGDALSWAGGFYVPVHFANDEIDWDIVKVGPADARLLAGPNVVLMEVRE